LNTLTKVLIVLVSLFSLFLCGIVATYVITGENYKKSANDNYDKWQTAKNKQASADRAREVAEKNVEDLKADLGQKLNDREKQVAQLQLDLENAKRINAELQQKVASMADIMANTSAADKEQTSLHEAAQQKVNTLEAERIAREKELEELNRTLLEKVTLLAQHESTIRRLTQENQELGARLDQRLAQYGKTATQPATTVAPGGPLAQPVVQPIAAVAPPTKNLGLNGQVTAVDARGRLVEISIGSAAGVRQEMVFHLIRGDQFVADVQIVEVWPDRAVGVLGLAKEGMQPQAGDRAATNL